MKTWEGFFGVLLVAFTLTVTNVGWQDKPPANPEVPAQSKVDILLAQRTLIDTQSRYATCTSTNWQQIYSQQNLELQKAVDAAYTASKVSKDEFDINLESLTFVKKAPPKKP